MGRLTFIAEVEFALPPVEEFEGAGRVRNFVAEVVGPAAVGVDIIEMLMKLFRQKPGDDFEIFVMMRGEPFRELLGGLRRAARGGGVCGNGEFTGTQHFYLLKNSVVL